MVEGTDGVVVGEDGSDFFDCWEDGLVVNCVVWSESGDVVWGGVQTYANASRNVYWLICQTGLFQSTHVSPPD